ncbi:putative secreted protein [Brazilian marseillevirus]|uniref:putative secreted protein n=1 Tax=Brazilian marseillevirus TaxID=1813599 RepID=UPI0007841B6B|nr:putative secreted protein [Brazilian marseillevirus]AMQ10589.1 putative secreted protein [Brazilian marseillevirus]
MGLLVNPKREHLFEPFVGICNFGNFLAVRTHIVMFLVLLVIVVLLVFLTASFCRMYPRDGLPESQNIWQLRVVKVKSPDASLPIKYGWWFPYQGQRNIPVSFIFERPDGFLIYSFLSNLPLPDKGSFLSNVEVPWMNVKIQDENENTLWSGQVQL